MKLKNLLILLLLIAGGTLQRANAQYCTPSWTYGCGSGDGIGGFSTSLGSTNISNANNGCNPNPTGYVFYNTMTHSSVAGSSFAFTGTSYTYSSSEYATIWVDWDQDNTFSAAELIYSSGVLSGAYAVFSGTYTVPVTALPGTTRMRVMVNYASVGTPCNSNSSSFGECEDYNFTVIPATPCSGAPTGGTTVASPVTPCNGNTSTLSVTGATLAGGLAYQWEELIASVWTPITGATGGSYTTPAITAVRTFRRKITCTNGSPAPAPAYSTQVTVTPYATSLPYCETFESLTAANTLPNCMTATNFPNATKTYVAPTGLYNQINHTAGGSKFASFYWNGAQDAFITPGFNLTAGTTYEFKFWYITDGYSGWNQLEAKYGTSPTLAGLTTTIGSVTPTPVINTVYKQFIQTFTPTTSGTYFIGVVCTHTTAPLYLTIDDICLAELPPCAGVPNAGATVGVPSTPCPGTVSELTLSATATYASGLTYQWEQATAVGGPYAPVTGGTGATTRYYTTAPITAGTWYRAKLTCTAGPDSAYSTPLLITPVVTTLPYTETFESITVNNQLPNCLMATNLGTSTRTYTSTYTGNQTNHTPGGSKFGNFYYYPAGQNAFITPGIQLTAGSTYLFTYWVVGYANNTIPWSSLSTYYGTTPTVAGLTNFVGSIVPNNTTYQQVTQTFTPATSGLYYVGIVGTSTGSTSSPYNYYVSIDDLGLVELIPCSGRPTAGTINPAAPCPNQNFTLSTTGTTSPYVYGGLTYAWYDSSSASGGVWQPSAGINTNLTYTTNINVPTKFKFTARCTSSAGIFEDTSAVLLVVPNSFINCYCIPTYATGATDRIITNVKVKNMSNSSTGAAPFYKDYTPNQPATIVIPTLTMGTADTVAVKHSTYTTNYSGVWIDFDHSGTFQTNEFFSQGTSVGANGVANIMVTPPLNSVAGLTRMRIRAGDGAIVTATMPCGPTGSAYGEAEDYFVNIQYPLCSGPTNAGRADASDTAICIGYSIDLYDTTHEYRRSQITWSWESSTDGGFTYNPVPSSINKDTLLNVTVTTAVKYRVKMKCDVTGDSTYSTPVNIRIKAPYECYCYSQSNGGPKDTSDIGAVVINTMINSTGGPHILNPTAIRRRTDYTYIPNILLNADDTYRLAIYHTQRNGVHADARVTVFIDYNNDLQYDAFASPNSERVYSGISTGQYFYIDTLVKIPNAVIPNAPTGLRVILNNDLNPLSPANLGCGAYVSGETEDYVVKFTRYPAAVGTTTNLQHVSIYPNPSSGKFVISAGAQRNMDNVEVTVSTITGQSVLHNTYNKIGTKFSEELNLTEAARGVYFVEVKTAAGDKMVQKLVIR